MTQTPGSIDVVRAWKDEEYRAGLPAEVRERLPAAPENLDQLSDEQLAGAAGGFLAALGSALSTGASVGMNGAALAGETTPLRETAKALDGAG